MSCAHESSGKRVSHQRRVLKSRLTGNQIVQSAKSKIIKNMENLKTREYALARRRSDGKSVANVFAVSKKAYEAGSSTRPP